MQSNQLKKLEKLSLYIAEDDAIQRFLLEKMADTLGLQVCGSASDGATAIEDIIRIKPSLILLDIGLNDSISGIEVAREVLNIYQPGIIFITANSDKKRECRRIPGLDFHRFIYKPISYHTLRNAVEGAEKALDLTD